MDRRGRAVLPQIILEEESEDDEKDVKGTDSGDDLSDVPPSGSKLKIRRRPIHSQRENLSPIPASPTFSKISIDSGEYQFAQFTDEEMGKMMIIGKLSEGRSRFGSVFKYLNRQSMTEYTVSKQKMNEKWAETKIQTFYRECEAFATVRHERIAKFYGFHINDTELTFFRTYTPSGTVEDKLHKDPLIESDALKYLTQTLEALRYCHNHSPKVLHRNIKASNLLLTISGDIKLCDFATSVDYDSPSKTKLESSSHYRRTLLASAPELLENLSDLAAYSEESDIWAVGCLLVEMLTTRPPYDDYYKQLSDEELYTKLRYHNTSEERRLKYNADVILPTASVKVAILLNRMMVYSRERRPDARELLTSPGMTGKTSPFVKRASINPIVIVNEEYEEMDYDNDPTDPIQERRSGGKRELSAAEQDRLLSVVSNGDSNNPMFLCGRWYCSRFLIFASLLFKWIGMVLLAALSLASVAAFVFFFIFVIYNGIGIVCQCNLNEGFVVLIALILLPILILLTTLCCNNSIEKYKMAKEDGSLEKCKYVYAQPPDDIVLCGVIVVEGSKKAPQGRKLRRKSARTEDETNIASGLKITAGFAHGVSKLA